MAPLPDKTPADLDASDYFLHLWRRRWVIIGLCAATLVLTYLGLKFFHPNSYEARALVMVRQQPRTTNLDIESEGIAPPSFKSMFRADETIIFVRNQYNQMVEQGILTAEEGYRRLGAPLEKYRERFRVESVTEIDTTIRTEFSPVMELRVRGNSRGQAKSLTELWLNHAMNKFGNLIAEEAQWRLDITKEKGERLSGELAGLVEEREALADERMLTDTFMASMLRRLTSAPLPQAITYAESDMLPYNVYSGPRQSSSDLTVDLATQEPGLLEELALLERRISLEKGDGGTAVLQQEHDFLAEQITSLRSDYQSMSERSAQLKSELARLDSEITGVQVALRINAGNAADAEAYFASAGDPEVDGDAAYSTLRVLSRPMIPDLRIWPKRILLAGMASLAVLAVLLLVFCCECYMRAAIMADERRRA